MPAWMLRLGEYDARLLHAFVVRRVSWLDIAMRFLTRLGDPPTAIALAGGLALGAIPALRGPGILSAFSLSIAFLMSQVLKRSIARPRPSFPVGLGALIQPPDRFSFPSGHATAALAMALPIAAALSGPLSGLVLALGLSVGVTRCYLGVHYPGDVLAGWALGALGFVLAEPVFLLFVA